MEQNQTGERIKSPSEASSRKWRAPLITVGVTVGLAILALLAWSVKGCAAEAERLPWPALDVPARRAASVDLADLGMDITGIRDAADTIGQGRYIDGVCVEYNYGGQRMASITLLKYPDRGSAAADFSVFEAWAEANAPTRVTFNMGSLGWLGWLKLSSGDAHSRIIWHDRWIVEVLALEGTDMPSGALLDKVLEATAAHWRQIEEGINSQYHYE